MLDLFSLSNVILFILCEFHTYVEHIWMKLTPTLSLTLLPDPSLSALPPFQLHVLFFL